MFIADPSLGHSKDFFDGCRVSVFPSKPAELLGVFTGYMAWGPAVVYLEVCDHEVPLVTSPVMGST